jgi:hypothetical protein
MAAPAAASRRSTASNASPLSGAWAAEDGGHWLALASTGPSGLPAYDEKG